MPTSEHSRSGIPDPVPTLLAIETSCDESAVAILRQGTDTGVEILASLISSQVALHRAYGGVV
ncbi:MAG: tRNA (adenosine(37)-N6)-threonylcarbamoyltransferase complex transferase subunit TsaD, partial [Verrucomicrobiota bacterium]|nr:tRNA (adenosine(37)-N6)-threonylcarbamoyltransferase complex transferase subunit TsaD [Verrucomicrobiota bacterium]